MSRYNNRNSFAVRFYALKNSVELFHGLFCLGKIPVVLSLLCCSSNAFAEKIVPAPTIDQINAEAKDYIQGMPAYTLTPFTDALPEGAVAVTIKGTKYYYTPAAGSDIKILQNLANIGNVALVETPDDNNPQLTYVADGKYYTYDTNELPHSGYTLEAADAKSETTVTLYDAAADGTLTPVYYNVVLNKTTYGDGDAALTYGWEKNADNRLEFKQDPSASVGQKITYNYDSAAMQNSRVENTADRSGDSLAGLFINQKIKNNSGTAYGGAVYNYSGSAKLGDINADFITNYAGTTSATAAGGGLFNRFGSVGNITGDFVGNYAESAGTVWGGGVLNWSGTIENITGDFIGNYIASSGNVAKGGAIHNDASKIGDITGSFAGNHASGNSTYGGAIYNTSGGTINNITGDFIGNYIVSSLTSQGGVFFNDKGKIENITGDFIGNYAFGKSAYGGAIYNHNKGSIGNITGDFIGNYAVSANDVVWGGAIFNRNGTIGNVNGNFIGNYIFSSNSAYGGAVYNYSASAELGDINANFINNYAKGASGTIAGGAIYNYYGKTGHITGDFTGNYAGSSDGIVWGGAILNWYGIIGNLIGDFTGNYVVSSDNVAKGGAIHNDNAKIGDITGSFAGNHASGNATYGGAVYNTTQGTIGDIKGDFSNNRAVSATSYARGGAVYNDNAKIGKRNDTGALLGGVYGSFLNNYAKTTSAYQLALGGAVFTNADMNFIADNKIVEFTGNYTEDSRGKISNAIFVENTSSTPTISLQALNNGTITFNDQIDGGSVSGTTINRTNTYNLNLTGDLTGKIALNDKIINAHATHDNVTLKIGHSDTFKDSTLTTDSGVIETKDGVYTNYNIKELNSSADTRYSIDISLAKDEQKADTFTLINGGSGVVYLSSFNVTNNYGYNEKFILQIIKSETDSAPVLDYDRSKVLQWATPNMTSDMIIAEDFGLTTTKTHNDSIAINGLLDAFPEWAELQTDEAKSFTFVDNSEYTLSRDIAALNGTNLTINGNDNILNLNNKNIFSDIKDTQEVSLNNMTVKNAEISNNGIINFDTITLDDSVNVNNNNIINISSKTMINADIAGTNGNMNITGGETTVNAAISNQSVSLANATMNLNNIKAFNNNSLSLADSNLNLQNLAANNLHLNDLKLANSNIFIGNIDVDLVNKSMGQIYADTYGDLTGKIDVQNLTLLNDALTDKTDVVFADAQLANMVTYSGNKTIAYSPIYKYDVTYGKNPEDNLGYFSFIRPGYASGNPSDSFNPSVLSAPVATQAGAYATQIQTFNYAFEHSDSFMNLPYQERLAVKHNDQNVQSSAGDTAGDRTSLLSAQGSSARYWMRPYAIFEHVPLDNGPKVSSSNYGTLIGYDSDIKTFRNGIDGVLTGYIGYHGSSQKYSGVDSDLHGGLVGSTVTLYEDNFFNATTASVGVSAGRNKTMYGKEDFTLLVAGIGNKAGYNFEFKEGKLILQPNFLMSYTFIDTFNYTNAAGVRIKSDPLNAIQLAPGLKLIGNLENGWQPYASVSMVWNLFDKSKFRADEIRLPEMSIDPYVRYGLGIQKRYNDKFSASGQAMIHSGGRNGVALTLDFRWAFGN